MSTETRQISVSGIKVEIVRKSIKNLHLGVYPPDGKVRVAAPKAVNDEAVRLAVVTRLPWIKRQRSKFRSQARQPARSYVSGESHYFMGRRYRLSVIERDKPPRIRIPNSRTIELSVRPNSTIEQKEKIFQDWCRAQLRQAARPLIEDWAKLLGVPMPDWGIRRMKTKWGSCNPSAPRVWLNLELAKKPPECISYIVAHELTHLIERNHNDKFVAILDHHLPQWRHLRDTLNDAPLKDERWAENQ